MYYFYRSHSSKGIDMKVTVFGIGYVGLVQGAVLSEVGHDVMCVDIDSDKVERLKQGHIPIYEPGLEALVKENYASVKITNLVYRHGYKTRSSGNLNYCYQSSKA